MKKLTVILGMLGVFALGCATASVMIDQAAATPPSGSTQCIAFYIRAAGPNEIEKGKHEEQALTLPPDWIPVGGGSTANAPVVVACRTAP